MNAILLFSGNNKSDLYVADYLGSLAIPACFSWFADGFADSFPEKPWRWRLSKKEAKEIVVEHKDNIEVYSCGISTSRRNLEKLNPQDRYREIALGREWWENNFFGSGFSAMRVFHPHGNKNSTDTVRDAIRCGYDWVIACDGATFAPRKINKQAWFLLDDLEKLQSSPLEIEQLDNKTIFIVSNNPIVTKDDKDQLEEMIIFLGSSGVEFTTVLSCG